MVKCGIYKITSPTGKIYIGQAVDVNKRWSEYNLNNSNLIKQPKIYRSLIKYGIDNHKFEIIEEKNCTREQRQENCINAGIYVMKRSFLEENIDKIAKNSLTGEMYFVDLIKMACDRATE